MGVHSEVVRIDLDRRDRRSGKPEPPKQLTDGRHSVQFWSVAPAASRMVFQLDEPTRLGDVWTLPLDGGQTVRVTGVYDTLDPTFDLPRQEKVSWRGTDGVTVEIPYREMPNLDLKVAFITDPVGTRIELTEGLRGK